MNASSIEVDLALRGKFLLIPVGNPRMYFAFVDDVEQRRPTRPEMGPIVGMRALLVDSNVLRDLEQGLYQLCIDQIPSSKP
jgi:hypothetical protein